MKPKPHDEAWKNQLYYGDNLEVLREKVPNEVADLIYLDPPFNSARSYNLLFKQVKGEPSPAQIHAFEDTWTWSPLLYEQFKADRRNARLFDLVEALYRFLGASEMMAYILMMAPRLLELQKKLKDTGSLYLHCDPSASHYLKLTLDAIFGPTGFVNEVVWKRTSAHSDARQGLSRFGRTHDVILFYARPRRLSWNVQFAEYDPQYLAHHYRNIEEGTGRRYKDSDLTAAKPGGDTSYEWKGARPPAGRYWAYSRENMERFEAEGRLVYSSGGMPRLKHYLDEMRGVPVGDVWTDVPPINSQARERRGYPTQKPLALLERIIAASSNPGDVVMDPFCGCGTALVAAERMGRKWIGIDITYLAINEVIHRLRTECAEGKPPEYRLLGSPQDALAAEQLFLSTASQNHKPFEQWAVTLVGGEYRDRGGADRGIDGVIPIWGYDGTLHRILIQVKGGNALTLSTVRDFASVIKDNNALLGLMVSMKQPTREMQLVCEQQGFAEWLSEKKYPKLQIRTVKELLEEPRRPFEVPDHARVPRQEGVGKKGGSQGLLFDG
ncbi:MAG: DNA methyltransferase [Acidobacteriota bacterium]